MYKNIILKVNNCQIFFFLTHASFHLFLYASAEVKEKNNNDFNRTFEKIIPTQTLWK